MNLYPHQITGADFLAQRGFAFLFDVPGLGKTATAVAACDRVGAQKILVICPAVVRRFWELTFLTWQKIKRDVTCIEGFIKHALPDGVSIISHECLADVAPPPNSKKARRDVYSVPMLWVGAPYDVIVLDEAHQFREQTAARTNGFFAPCGLWEAGRQVFALTGTPIVNSAADLYPAVFGPLRTPVSWWDWCTQFAGELRPDGHDSVRPIGLKRAPELAVFLQPHCLRRTLDSLGIELPPLTTYQVPIALPPSELQAAMAGLEKWTPARLQYALEQGSELKDAALAKVRHALGVAKAQSAAFHVGAVLKAGDGPVVAFFQHTRVREIMYEQLSGAGYRVSWIDGTVTRKQLAAAQAWFQAGQIDVLLVQTQCGSQGLTLTQAHRVVIAELSWTSVAIEQSIKRIHRISQTQPCTAEILCVQDCWLEDALLNAVNKKHVAAEQLLSLLTSSS